MQFELFDWAIISAYLILALLVGFWVKEKAQTDRVSYFLAGRSLPWWWAGTSIAATTFAADTPLAITGIVAERGLSGNWIWMAWIGVHAAMVIVFARLWRNSGVITDAEFIARRYSGRQASVLRWFRATLYGFVYNAIILGWVLRAMSKIVEPFFHWEDWLPGVTRVLSALTPENSPLGTPSDILTIVVLVLVVTIYSSIGGIRGVIFTDLIQFTLGLVGSIWFAVVAWNAVGGKEGMLSGLDRLYGSDHQFLNLFPQAEGGWLDTIGLGAFMFGIYLIVQSYANVPSDGGGFTMQRLNTCKDATHARKAAFLFMIWQYFVRIWPWFIVAIAALVLIPLGQESAYPSMIDGQKADRELAYSVLMGKLLPPGVLGLMVTSLFGAFMSTIDTHFNWGASYVVNDIFLKIRPNAPAKTQIRVARLSVAGFALMAILVSFQIETIEQAWKWVAFIGAALGIPTALRWLWWRVNASAELLSMFAGLGAALIMISFTDLPFELHLIYTTLASLAGMLIGIAWGTPTDPRVIENFQQQVKPIGFWPAHAHRQARNSLVFAFLKILLLIGGSLGIWLLGCYLLFGK